MPVKRPILYTMKMRIIVVAILLLECLACSAPICRLESVQTLLYTAGYQGKDGPVTYAHYILTEGLYRNCMDSAAMVDLALKYIDTVKVAKPIVVVKLFNSRKNFSPSSYDPPDMKIINKNCLVSIGFDQQTRKPYEFLFYNDGGDIIYWGKRWQPGGGEIAP
jgi:hypothetical protein